MHVGYRNLYSTFAFFGFEVFGGHKFLAAESLEYTAPSWFDQALGRPPHQIAIGKVSLDHTWHTGARVLLSTNMTENGPCMQYLVLISC